MTAEIVVTLAPTRDVEIVLFDECDTTLDIGVPAQVAAIALDAIFRGPKGDEGPKGDIGPIGPAGGAGFTYQQPVAATVWSIAHGLNRFPSVTVVDSAGTEVEGAVQYPDVNHVVVTFAFPFAGQAYLN